MSKPTRNRWCPACGKSQPVLDLPDHRICTTCSYRWERVVAEPAEREARKETA